MAPSLPALPVGRLARDGGYPRYLQTSFPPAKGTVHRKWCSACRTCFVLLPNDVVPLHKYSLQLICDRLDASFAGQSDHSRDFYEEQGLLSGELPTEGRLAPTRAMSWSDQVCSEPPRPSPQIFRHWRLKWPSRAQVWLPKLLLACIHASCDLKMRLGESLTGYINCPESMWPLVLATGLAALLQEESAEAALPAAVFLLGCSTSHKISRVSGRPPPHYGGDLEFPQLRAD